MEGTAEGSSQWFSSGPSGGSDRTCNTAGCQPHLWHVWVLAALLQVVEQQCRTTLHGCFMPQLLYGCNNFCSPPSTLLGAASGA
jgi:hypothetical protein